MCGRSNIASDGNKCVWATAKEARQPITTVIEDGTVSGSRRAVEYWEVATKVKALMRRDNAARDLVTSAAAE